MKLVLSITRHEEANQLIDALMDREFRATRINTRGGFLKKGNATVVIGIEDEHLEDVLALIRENASPASVFVLDVTRHERL